MIFGTIGVVLIRPNPGLACIIDRLDEGKPAGFKTVCAVETTEFIGGAILEEEEEKGTVVELFRMVDVDGFVALEDVVGFK